MENNLLSLIIFAPLAGAAINWFVGRRLRNEKLIGLIACGSVGISTIVAFYLAFKSGGALRSTEPVFDHLWTWIQVGKFRADFGLAMDRLSGTYALFVTFVGFLIHVFAVGYMHEDSGFYRFFAFLNLFMFSMLTLVLADNFLLMFVGWEGVGLCSYLLIGFYIDRKEAGDAAKKAFITNRVGDWGFVMGIMLLFFITSAAGNASISFFDHPGTGVTSAFNVISAMPVEAFAWKTIFAGGLTSVAVLLFIGAAGKSAQIPLYVWLPDAMAGPTPVSALIHAATMVTAGVYMIVRCSAIYVHAPTAMFIVAIIGAATALICRHHRPRAERHQEGSRLLDHLAAWLHVSGLRTRRLYSGNLSRHHARVLQGASLPRLRFSNPRHASRAGHAAHGRTQEIHAHHVCDHAYRLAGDFGHTDLCRLLFEG